jgi:hypothetical protein
MRSGSRRSGLRPLRRLLPVLVVLALSSALVAGLGTHRADAATQGDLIVSYAAAEAGVAYCDGGGGLLGPSHGNVDESGCEAGVKGFDCMSLAQYAVYQGTGIALPGDGSQLSGVGQFIPPSDTADLLPGDVVYWGGTINGFAHSGVYAGNSEVWDAIGVNVPVQEHTMTQLAAIYNYDGAIRYWSTSAGPAPSGGTLAGPVVGMAATPDGSGYWLADAAGAVSAHGGAPDLGSLAGETLNAPITHIVSTPDGKGYWLVAADGGTFAFGDAGFYGSMGGRALNAPIVDIAPTADGRGYWLVGSDGGIFAFGDAKFQGSMGGQPLNDPVVGIVADDRTGGYWEVGSDGGIFAFGARFYGSAGDLALNEPVNGMTATADDQGYLFVASDGGIFAYGDAAFAGSTGGSATPAPIVGVAVDSATGGYWEVDGNGDVYAFNAPFYGAD